MLKEVRILRQDIRRTWDGSLIKISRNGQPDKFQNTDRYLIDLVDKAVRAVREDCANMAEWQRCGIEPEDNPRDRVVRMGIAMAIRARR